MLTSGLLKEKSAFGDSSTVMGEKRVVCVEQAPDEKLNTTL
jgi:hypothetical protein